MILEYIFFYFEASQKDINIFDYKEPSSKCQRLHIKELKLNDVIDDDGRTDIIVSWQKNNEIYGMLLIKIFCVKYLVKDPLVSSVVLVFV